MLQRQKRAVVTGSKPEQGSLDLAFDSNSHTAVRVSPSTTQAFFQVALDRPRPVEFSEATFAGEGAYSWSLSAADSAADMEGRKGSYRALSPARATPGEQMDQVTFIKPRAYRVYRLECRRQSGEGPLGLAEWALWSPQELAQMEVAAPVLTVANGGKLPLRVDGRFDAGARQNLTPDVTWEISPPARANVDPFTRLVGREPGPVRLTAHLGSYRSQPIDVEVLPEGKPDFDVTYIERQPRVDYQAPESALKIGQNVYWFAHVKNYGTADAEPVNVRWRVDGEVVRAGHLPKLDRFGQTEAVFSTQWDGKRHEIELTVDPDNEVAETCKENNTLKVYSDALSVGFWVEESTIQYFHRHQHELGAGSNSWEDWAQRQVAFWNGAPQAAAPAGKGGERWRLDRIVVVGDGMLPLSEGQADRDPDRRDTSVQLMWGFPAYDPARSDLYRRTAEKSPENPFYTQKSLLEARNHVRFPPAGTPPPAKGTPPAPGAPGATNPATAPASAPAGGAAPDKPAAPQR